MSDDETTVAPTEQAPEQITAWSDCQQDDELDGDRHTWWMLSGYVAVMALLVVMLAVVLFIVTRQQSGSTPTTNQIAAPRISITSTVLVTPPPLPPSPVTSTVTATAVPTMPTTTTAAPTPVFDAAKDQYLLNWLEQNTTPYTWSVLRSDPAKVIRYAHQTCFLLQIEPIAHVDQEIAEATGWDDVTTSMVTSSATTVYPNCPLRQS